MKSKLNLLAFVFFPAILLAQENHSMQLKDELSISMHFGSNNVGAEDAITEERYRDGEESLKWSVDILSTYYFKTPSKDTILIRQNENKFDSETISVKYFLHKKNRQKTKKLKRRNIREITVNNISFYQIDISKIVADSFKIEYFYTTTSLDEKLYATINPLSTPDKEVFVIYKIPEFFKETLYFPTGISEYKNISLGNRTASKRLLIYRGVNAPDNFRSERTKFNYNVDLKSFDFSISDRGFVMLELKKIGRVNY